MNRDATIVLRLLRTDEGGRKGPILPGILRGMMTFDGTQCHDFRARIDEDLYPGEARELDVAFLCPDLVAPKIVVGTPFVLMEGRPIGHGHMLACMI